MRQERIKEVEEMLAQLYQDLTTYDKLLGVESDPLEYRKLGIKQELCRQNIERYERELKELSDKNDFEKLTTLPANSTSNEKVDRLPQEAVRPRQEIRPALRRHYDKILDLFKQGRVVPVLGSEINLCGRPTGVSWQPHSQYLPTEKELAAYLARSFEYPEANLLQTRVDLAWISQYAAVVSGGPGPLYDELRYLLDNSAKSFHPNPAHEFLAYLPKWLSGQSENPRFPIVMTTNYDNVLELTFEQNKQPYDLVSYIAEGAERDQFLHWSYDRKDASPIKSPNDYRDLPLYQRTVILKMHGAVNPERPERDSFVITEDHHINYLTSTEISKLVPTSLIDKLRWSYLLFLGYNLRDWNLRVLLYRIWSQTKLAYPSWAIELQPQELNRKFWKERNVELLDISLEDYLTGLTERMRQVSDG